MERTLSEHKDTLTGLDNLLHQSEPDVQGSKLEIIKLLQQLSNNKGQLASNRLELRAQRQKLKG
jgi:hypothetical protein